VIGDLNAMKGRNSLALKVILKAKLSRSSAISFLSYELYPSSAIRRFSPFAYESPFRKSLEIAYEARLSTIAEGHE
jgi:hypothetical protein